jgi:hypothetical protein
MDRERLVLAVSFQNLMASRRKVSAAGRRVSGLLAMKLADFLLSLLRRVPFLKTFTVECEWDDEAKVWFISDSDVPGLSGEATTVEELSELLRSRIPELLALNCPDDIRQEREVPWQLIARKQDRIALAT